MNFIENKPFVPYHELDREALGFYLAGLIEGDGTFPIRYNTLANGKMVKISIYKRVN